MEIRQTATIDIGEIVARIHNIEIGETDAIFVCCGLGGSMVDVAPHIIAALRSSIDGANLWSCHTSLSC